MNELMIDSINIEDISFAIKNYPIAGITCNPTILKREGHIDVVKHLEKVISIKGDIPLHIQVVSLNRDDIINEAHDIINRFGKETYIKIPVTEDGIAAMKVLSKEGIKITATVVCNTYQGILAVISGAKYIAVYYSRMLNNDLDPSRTIKEIRQFIDESNADAKVLGASFKSVDQIIDAYVSGAKSNTVSYSLIREGLDNHLTKEWVDKFKNDFEDITDKEMTMSKLIK